jgi:cyclopropane-fatty-acyl-phospholipid synthase
MLIQKAQLKPTDKVLEIGFGWGFLSRTIAKEIGCHVTGVCLSVEQTKYAEAVCFRFCFHYFCFYFVFDFF